MAPDIDDLSLVFEAHVRTMRKDVDAMALGWAATARSAEILAEALQGMVHAIDDVRPEALAAFGTRMPAAVRVARHAIARHLRMRDAERSPDPLEEEQRRIDDDGDRRMEAERDRNE